MVTKSIAIDTVKQFVNDCKTQGLSITSAWLFGSYVHGNPNRNSDIDLALVSDTFGLNFIENNHKTALINYKYPDIEVHHFSSIVFTKDDPFINEILRTGIKIYEQPNS